MQSGRNAIGTIIAAAVVIFLVVAAGTAIFVLSPSLLGTPSGTSTTSGRTTSSTMVPSTSTTSDTSISSSSSTSTEAAPSSTPSTSTTSVQSQSVSSTTTQGSSESTATCVGPTATTATGSYFPSFYNFTAYFATFSKMSIRFNETTTNGTSQIDASYSVLSHYNHVYKLNVTESVKSNGTSAAVDYIFHVADAGNVTSAYFSSGGYSQNYTGAQAQVFYLGALPGLLIEQAFSSPFFLNELTNSGFVHVAASGTETIGFVQLAYTNYDANSLPLVIPSCGGYGSTDFTQFSLQTAAAQGSPLVLLTSLVIDGSFPTGQGATMSVDVQVQIVSLTAA